MSIGIVIQLIFHSAVAGACLTTAAYNDSGRRFMVVMGVLNILCLAYPIALAMAPQ